MFTEEGGDLKLYDRDDRDGGGLKILFLRDVIYE